VTTGGFTTLQLKGRLDLNSSSQLKEHIKGLLKQGTANVILDLCGVDFINSSGLGTLVSILKDVRIVKGRMVLCNLAQYVQEIFEVTQLSHIFDIYPTAEEAAASFAGRMANAY
jgi:anti-sigma B factor antagonist